MSRLLDFDNISDKLLDKIVEECTVKRVKTLYDPNPSPLRTFFLDETRRTLTIPLDLYNRYEDKLKKCLVKTKKPKRKYKLKYELLTKETDPKKYRDQDVVAYDASVLLNTKKRVYLNLPTGFGKSKTGIYLSTFLEGKILVICGVSIVNDQWVEDFKENVTVYDDKTQKYRPVNVQYVKTKNLDPSADVYVMGVLKLSKMDHCDPELYNIKTVVYDEAHMVTETACTSSLLKVNASYLICLSATYDKGIYQLLSPYVGPPEEYIKRKEIKNFTVVKYYTQYMPEVKYKMMYGKRILDWTTIVNSLAKNTKRQQEIATLAIRHPKDFILILLSRVEECQELTSYLKEQKEDACHIKDDKSSHNHRILVGTIKIIGTGYNNPRLTMLILGIDLKDVRQFEGRIRTADNIIYDIIDKFPTCYNHAKLRQKWYISKGAKIIEEGQKLEEKKKETVKTGLLKRRA